MSRLALLMAGGQGNRMLQSGVEVIKPLVSVAGIPLIERNVQQLLKHGFNQIIISANEQQTNIIEFSEKTLRPLINSMNGSLDYVTEKVSLGNIGAAKLLAKYKQPAMVVYADNITSLDLRAVYDQHLSKESAMTIAVHTQTFKMPYGEILLRDDFVCEYNEKPISEFLVCSAIAVLGSNAIQSIPSNHPFGISDLVRLLIAEKKCVSAFKHNAQWVDVNDHSSILEVESMVQKYANEFELWAPQEPVSGGVIDLTAIEPKPKTRQKNLKVKTQQIDCFCLQTSSVKRWTIRYYQNDFDAFKKARSLIYQSIQSEKSTV